MTDATYTEADFIIDGLGGTSAVAELIFSKPSTVHSWRKNGIPEARLDHLKLAAAARGKEWPVKHPDGDSGDGQAESPNGAAENCPSEDEAA